MLNKLMLVVADRLWEKLAPVITAKIEEYAPIIAEKLMALLPVIVATATKAVTDQFSDVFAKILEADPDIPVVSDVFDLSETIRGNVNQSIPDIDIPVLSDIFDLTELFNQRR